MIEWSGDGSRLYVVDAGGIDILSGEPLAITDRIEWARPRAATWSPDRSMVALSSSEPGVELIDIVSGEEIASLDAERRDRRGPGLVSRRRDHRPGGRARERS